MPVTLFGGQPPRWSPVVLAVWSSCPSHKESELTHVTNSIVQRDSMRLLSLWIKGNTVSALVSCSGGSQCRMVRTLSSLLERPMCRGTVSGLGNGHPSPGQPFQRFYLPGFKCSCRGSRHSGVEVSCPSCALSQLSTQTVRYNK